MLLKALVITSSACEVTCSLSKKMEGDFLKVCKFLHTDKLFLHQLFIRLMLKSETFYPTLGGLCLLTDTVCNSVKPKDVVQFFLLF